MPTVKPTGLVQMGLKDFDSGLNMLIFNSLFCAQFVLALELTWVQVLLRPHTR